MSSCIGVSVLKKQSHPVGESNVFTCRNQSCGAQWEQSDVVIKNEGQGLLFRCPMCGARNYIERFDGDDGSVLYEQIEGRPFQ
jgi:NAD-dependent SIR2 family protein deacetylase